MVNTKKIQNIDLLTEIGPGGIIPSGLAIIELTEENLKEMGWMDDIGWPSGELLEVMKDLDTISPSDFEHGAKFWDQIKMGLSVYNNFFEDGEND